MKKMKIAACSALLALAVLVSACVTAPADADYTLRTEKWSRAPRDKFYRIVKVPKTPEVTACEAGKTAQEDCPQK
ncbi:MULTISPECIES: hypothetical protein [Asticcacaulis]|uniref:hypothetical protein n=1 Tax=Asticcacaulis TaxID=76890 RepID=UPI001AE8078E|nr:MULTISPECIES: hypothetical protein [Asticcacaulis]MBP2160471.1 PBP1b-binding outer membrane lipoprotein LpoB [Asticcacaulis solisilvae]MDR6801516.1 PBP1b-binding outer membrane lipoprotein LpoB [Asticcacaulis sp. BE141]